MSVSVVVPTFNRAEILKVCISNLVELSDVDEIVIVDDCSSDDTSDIVRENSAKFLSKEIKYIRNPSNMGAGFSRMRGVEQTQSEFVLFSDDDNELTTNYVTATLRVLREEQADIVSGRHLYAKRGESIHAAIDRFGQGEQGVTFFDSTRFRANHNAFFTGNATVPFTHGIFLARRDLVVQHGIDAYYSKGNGYREETDLQLSVLSRGGKIVVTNDCHAVHCHPSKARKGGQRVNRIRRFYWTIAYTRYLLNKYYGSLRESLGLSANYNLWFSRFIIAETYVFFLRPLLQVPTKINELLYR